MTYYVYGTFISRDRFKFKTKKEANAFRKWANEKGGIGRGPIDWVFPPYEETQKANGFEIIDFTLLFKGLFICNPIVPFLL